MMSSAQYIVRERETGRELVRGSAPQCADALGVTYKSYLMMVSLARRGRTRYIIERIDSNRPRPAPDEAVYPCGTCRRAARCYGADQVCPAWQRWFEQIYDTAAQRIRAATKKEEEWENNG